MANIFEISRTDNKIILGTANTTINITPMTANSIPFFGASGLLSQDNDNMFWNNTTKRLSLGGGGLISTVITPQSVLHISTGSDTSPFRTTAVVGNGLTIESKPSGVDKTGAYINLWAKDEAIGDGLAATFGAARILGDWEDSPWNKSRLIIQTHADNDETWTNDVIIQGGNIAILGKLTAGSFGSPTDVTNTRQHGFEIHYSGNNYNVTAIRARAQLVTTDTTATAQGALLQAANNDNINAGVLNGALIEAIGKATTNAATITMMRGCLVNTEWSAKDTVTDLRVLHVRTHTRDAATEGYVSGTGYGVYIENEAVGGNGQVLDAGIYFKGTNLSAGNKAFTYGIDFQDATYGTAEIIFSNGETISNFTDGQIDLGGIVNATGGFKDNGTAGVDGTFEDNNGNTVTVSGGIITDLGV